jgi:hypothetical protein
MATQFDLFQAILCCNEPELKTLAQQYCLLMDLNGISTHFGKIEAAALLCLDSLFKFSDDGLSQLESDSEDSALRSLDLFNHYARLMQRLSSHPSPWLVDSIMKLFAFSRAGEDNVEVRSGTFAYHVTRHGSLSDLATARQLAIVSNRRLLNCFRVALCGRLRKKVHCEESHFKNVNVFQPCLRLVATGRCYAQHNYAVAHDLDIKWFNRRVRFYLLQIMILHSIHIIPHPEEFLERINQRR